MLKKLLKHEMVATSRTFILMYAVLIILTIVNKISITVWWHNDDLFSGFRSNDILTVITATLSILLLVGYILICAAVFIMTTVLIVSRFYKNMTGDEGYLFHTLPVTTSQNIIAKLLISVFWLICSTLMFILSLIILLWGFGIMDEIRSGFNSLYPYYDIVKPQVITLIILYILMLFVGYFQSTLLFYLSIAIGQLFNKYRILMAIVAYFGISFPLQIIYTIIGFISSINMSVSLNELHYYDDIAVIKQVLGYTNGSFGLSLLGMILLSIIYFFVTNYIMSRKLNLE